MTEQCSVACTIMAKDTDGDYVFLVEDEPEGFSFIKTVQGQDKTGLASIIGKVKTELAIDFSELELYELTNAVVANQRIPLFVFSCRDEEMHFEEVLNGRSNLKWRRSRELAETFESWKIAGVPQFQKNE